MLYLLLCNRSRQSCIFFFVSRLVLCTGILCFRSPLSVACNQPPHHLSTDKRSYDCRYWLSGNNDTHLLLLVLGNLDFRPIFQLIMLYTSEDRTN